MQNPSMKWTKWSNTLARFKVKNLSIWLLEIGEPFMPIGAQLLYLGQPFLGYDRVKDLANLLEDKEEARAFKAYLKKE